MTPTIALDGPTSFAPLIDEAARQALAAEPGTFTLLVIITDGAVTEPGPSRDAIVAACRAPLGIIAVGVGDGPWDQMTEFDEHLPEREWDNFHVVLFHHLMTRLDGSLVAFAAEALREVPAQYMTARKLGLLSARKRTPATRGKRRVND